MSLSLSIYIYIYIPLYICICICICMYVCIYYRSWRRARPRSRRGNSRQAAPSTVRTMRYSCISMQRYWSSLRYSFLRTVFVGRRLRRHPTPARPFPSFLCSCWCGLSRAGFLSFPAPFSLRVSTSRYIIYIFTYVFVYI